jgi:ketosteroid isomerase-like protein
MTEHPNAANTRRGYEAWNSGRLDVFREFLSEDAIMHFAGNNAMSGTYRGRDTVMDTLGRLIQGWGPHHVEVEAVLASDDHVIAFQHAISEHDGKTLDIVLAQPMKVNAEGKLTEGWFIANDQRAFDQFWS